MALSRIPVDMAAMPFSTATLAMIRPRLDEAGAQRKNDDGTPLWEYDFLILPEGRRPEIIPIVAPSATTPSYTPGGRASVRDCYGRHYSIKGDNGKISEGFSFSAAAVIPLAQKND